MRYVLTICAAAACGLWWRGSETLLERGWIARPASATHPVSTESTSAIRRPISRLAMADAPPTSTRAPLRGLRVAANRGAAAIGAIAQNWLSRGLDSDFGISEIGIRLADQAHLGEGLLLAPLWLAADSQAAAPPAAAPASESAAKGNYQPISPERLADTRKELDAKLAALEKFLAGDAAAEAGWKDYLRWDQLQAELAHGQDAKPELLREISARYIVGGQVKDQPGLELEQFRAVHAALDRYAGLLAEARTHDGQAQFQKRFDDLTAALERYRKSPSGHDADTIGTILGELEASGQAPELVEATRAQLDHPNLFVRASQDFITKMTQTDVQQENEPLNDSILGTQITGKTDTHGSRSARLLESPDHVAMEMTLDATTESHTTGYHPPVTIQAHGTTQIHGVKRISMDAEGSTDEPACVHASTHTTIDSLCICGGRLVQRIATKKVYQGKPEAECIASQHAEARAGEQFNSNATEALAAQNKKWLENYRNPLLRRSAFPQTLHYASSPAALTVTPGIRLLPAEDYPASSVPGARRYSERMS